MSIWIATQQLSEMWSRRYERGGRMTYKECIRRLDCLILHAKSFRKEEDDVWDMDIRALEMAKRIVKEKMKGEKNDRC